MSNTYFSKYAEVEAVLFKDDGSNLEEIQEFGGEAVEVLDDIVWVITNNGTVVLHPGHYLMKGVSDFYPCDPVTFQNRWQSKPHTVEFSRTALLESDDAMVWAQEFVKCVNQRPTIATDEGTMVGWFANAMGNAISFNRERRAEDQKLIADLTQSDPGDVG